MPYKYSKIWNGLKNKKYLSKELINKTELAIAISFARSQSPQAMQWLRKVDYKYFNTNAWEWLLRVEIYNSDFKGYIKSYQLLPSKIKKEAAWQYWLAYSYDFTGQKSKAKSIYQKLVSKPLNYYALLSADALDIPYKYGKNNVQKLSESQIKKLSQKPNILQAIELYKIGQFEDSAKLWKWAIKEEFKNGDKSQIINLARLAWFNEMYYQSIFSTAYMGLFSNTRLLYPNTFDDIVTRESNKYDVRRSLIYSIIRKESMFHIEANSSAGAKGLMQVTLPTADFISKKYNLNLHGKNMSGYIYDPYVNIRIGSANLDFLDSLFKGNIILGIAAYNAGPGNVEKWLNNKSISAKQWIEAIPFGETRHYIRKVLVNMIIYNNFILKAKKIKLSDILNSEISKNLISNRLK